MPAAVTAAPAVTAAGVAPAVTAAGVPVMPGCVVSRLTVVAGSAVAALGPEPPVASTRPPAVPMGGQRDQGPHDERHQDRHHGRHGHGLTIGAAPERDRVARSPVEWRA